MQTFKFELKKKKKKLDSYSIITLISAPDQLGPTRLSGSGMRDHLLTPGNNILYIAKKKNGITTQLPVV